ncbi:MAG TPA: SPOR domain-containing protein [Actinocrinis sp.]|nr:SPOR domain-containing protein [Actinocrinis sp.]
MTESAPEPPWRVVRQDDNGNRYLVGRHATREEAERVIARLEAGGHKQLYWIEGDSDGSAAGQ